MERMSVVRNASAKVSFLSMKAILLLTILILPAIVRGYPSTGKRVRNVNGIDMYENMFQLESNPMELNKLLLPYSSDEIPGKTKSRQKRLSDQRRAELETLMALSKMTGKLVTTSRDGRQLDATKIGRHRRSVLDNLKILNYLSQLSGNMNNKGNGAYPIIG